MNIHSELAEPLTPGISYENSSYWKNEDSGYHTSYTPGSLECSEVSSDSVNSALINGKICFSGSYQVDCFNLTPDVNVLSNHKYNFTSSIRNNEFKDSPQNRRGIKRAFQDDSENTYSSIPTPTTLIAGGLRKLKFNDGNRIKTSKSLGHTDSLNEFYNFHNQAHTFPSTPVKKLCRTSCKLNSPLSLKRPAKKLNFVIHSLSCESQGLQQVSKVTKPKAVKSIQFKPEQKIDIIKMLYEKANVTPPLMKICSYLSNEDIYNFTLVSPVWLRVWEDVSEQSKQLEYINFLKRAKENQENKEATPKTSESNPIRPLMEIHNVINNNIIPKAHTISPPGTPRTIKFKKFTKTAALDLRKQLSCVRCHQPAKVTEESTGEEWVECTSSTCSYQFCKFCRCDRHSGKSCFQYDLDGPSPSKRKKNTCAVGTKKSRKNLRRLL
ncbi:uncharacterized protein LOC119829686 [Zerene cesonia]|uniref:uncharacterized protein LOC119829686 n=1 Tax=Zerene cesonia TaxID=33412 RepID=UPI0018E555EB|nr:uncharacterized protein LOC119829686 [Zerene cesonia]